MRALSTLAIATLLTGCATSGGSSLSPEDRAEAEKPLICGDAGQCKMYWERAMFYVNSHTRLKIQTANDNMIQTFSPTGGSTNLGYLITREPLGDGRYRIWIKTWCDNMFGCTPDPIREGLDFKRYVTGS